MPKFTKKQKDEATHFLTNPRELKAGWSSTQELEAHSAHLLETYKAKIVLGEFRQDTQTNDLHVARTCLTPADMAELHAFIGAT